MPQAEDTTTTSRLTFASAGATRARTPLDITESLCGVRPQAQSTTSTVSSLSRMPARPVGIEINYANLLDNLAEAGPVHNIRGAAGRADIEEYREHLRKVLGAVKSYVAAVLGNLACNATCGIDCHSMVGLLDDAIGDINGTLMRHADNLALWGE